MTGVRSQERRKSVDQWDKECTAWNIANPVGTPVILTRDSGEEVKTKTRSEAYVSDAGYGVIFLEGVTGYYLLDRVTPACHNHHFRAGGCCPFCGETLPRSEPQS